MTGIVATNFRRADDRATSGLLSCSGDQATHPSEAPVKQTMNEKTAKMKKTKTQDMSGDTRQE